MPFGVMGGHYQPVGHAHFLTNFIDFDLDVQGSTRMRQGFLHSIMS
ncbi:MAG: hypothetical protein CM1200mP4_0630 [Rhodospirillaceae bacterium]|nr:MAG: hypothetical protein CM1200mP4_0630 [Rhodospirillaceae bacterium]